MNLPAMRRGLSPEGRKIREKHQGSLTIGVQGITVHPAERVNSSRSRRDFLHDNVKRLREIQARCKERETSKRPQPLRATRDSSASTSSSLRQADSLVQFRNGSSKLSRRRQSPDREGSAHSDYFSLAEEHIEPLKLSKNERCAFTRSEPARPESSSVDSSEYVINSDCRESPVEPESRSASRLSQVQPPSPHMSPSRSSSNHAMGSPRKPRLLSHRPLQASPTVQTPPLRRKLVNGEVLESDYTLTKELRRLRMDSLMSKIKNQKPACEIDYNTHYKTIESQHRVLLDSADVLSLYGSGDVAHVDSGTQRSARNIHSGNSKMTRARSFDRELSNRKSGSSAVKLDRLDSASNKKNARSSPQPPSPLMKRKLSKSIGNLGSANFSVNTPKSVSSEAVTKRTEEGRWIKESENRKNSPLLEKKGKSVVNGFERSKSNLERRNPHVIDPLDLTLSDEELEYPDVINPSSRAPSSQGGEVNLNTTITSSCDLNFLDQDQSYDARPEEFQLNVLTESQNDLHVIDNQRRDELREAIQESEQSSAHERSFKNEEGRDSACEGDQLVIQNAEPDRTSTPVPNVKVRTNTPKPKRREAAETQRSTLRRSQSLKNVKQQQPGDPPSSYQRGRLPRYLQARKEEEHRLAEIAKSVDPDCPPGHAPLPEYERRNTLHLLRKSQAEVMSELSSLPVAQDTLRVKRKRHDLEEKLMQIEDGLRIFSQPKVYVVNDE